VSPAYGDISLALVKYRNEGERQKIGNKMQGDPGTQEIIKEEDTGPIRATQQVHVYLAFSSEAGDKNYLAPPSGYQSKPGRTPYPPPQGTPLPQVNFPSRTSLGGNLTSASKSGLKVIVLTQDEQGEHFKLNGASLRGQAAELETRTDDPRAYQHWRASRNQAGHHDASMANWYGVRVDIRGTSVPFPHLATTLGEDHISIYMYIEKKLCRRTCSSSFYYRAISKFN
jgi:hypothetical protein